MSRTTFVGDEIGGHASQKLIIVCQVELRVY